MHVFSITKDNLIREVTLVSIIVWSTPRTPANATMAPLLLPALTHIGYHLFAFNHSFFLHALPQFRQRALTLTHSLALRLSLNTLFYFPINLLILPCPPTFQLFLTSFVTGSFLSPHFTLFSISLLTSLLCRGFKGHEEETLRSWATSCWNGWVNSLGTSRERQGQM